MAKLWAGRFEKPTNALLDDFQSSIPFDQRMLDCDVNGSIAHATMLGEQGIITPEDAKAIVAGLEQILADLKLSEPIEEGGEVFYPGERSLLNMRQNRELGIPVVEEVWNSVLNM